MKKRKEKKGNEDADELIRLPLQFSRSRTPSLSISQSSLNLTPKTLTSSTSPLSHNLNRSHVSLTNSNTLASPSQPIPKPPVIHHLLGSRIWFIQRDSSKSSPSATTTAQVMIESPSFSSSNTDLALILELSFL